jgi:hypothetical protein
MFLRICFLFFQLAAIRFIRLFKAISRLFMREFVWERIIILRAAV